MNFDQVRRCFEVSGTFDTYARVNPYTSSAKENLKTGLDEASSKLLRQIAIQASGDLDVPTLRNIVAFIRSDLFELAILARGLRLDDITKWHSLCESIDTAIKNESNDASILLRISAPQADILLTVPAEFKGCRPSIRVRYALAKKSRHIIDLKEVLPTLDDWPGASPSIVARELQILFKERAESPPKPIALPAFKSLSLLLQKEILSSDGLYERLVKSSQQRESYVKEVPQRLAGYYEFRSELSNVVELISKRDSQKANALAEKLDFAFLNARVMRVEQPRLTRALCHPQIPADLAASWEPLSPKLATLVTRCLGTRQGYRHLFASKAEVIASLVEGGDLPKGISEQDLHRLDQSLTHGERKQLVGAARFDLPLTIPDSILIDHIEAFAEACATGKSQKHLDDVLTGPPARRKLLERFLETGKPVLRDAIKEDAEYRIGKNEDGSWLSLLFLQSIDERTFRLCPQTEIFLSAVAEAISDGAEKSALTHIENSEAAIDTLARALSLTLQDNLEPRFGNAYRANRFREAWNSIGILCQQSDVIKSGLSHRVSVDDISGYLKAVSVVHPQAVNLLRFRFDLHNDDDSWRLWFRASGDTQQAIHDLVQRPALIDHFTPNLIHEIRPSRDTQSEQIFSVICLRYSPRSLKRRLMKLHERDARHICEQAAKQLPERSRSRAYFELLTILDISALRPLAACLARMDREAPSGHRFDNQYVHWELPKRSGGKRVVSAPDPVLKRLQRAILDAILSPLGQHESAHGFVPKRSIVSNASPHVGKSIVTNCDIKNCFPSVSWKHVLGVCRRDLSESFSDVTISTLVDICTANGGLPIGAPTSPALLNRVLLRTDEILSKAAHLAACDYTRYADDLTFSGDDTAVKLIAIAEGVLKSIGLDLDPKKTNIYRRGRRQIVTGLAVNERVSVPRRIRRRLRAAVHAIEQGRDTHWHGKPQTKAALAGRIAFVKGVNENEGHDLMLRLTATDSKP